MMKLKCKVVLNRYMVVTSYLRLPGRSPDGRADTSSVLPRTVTAMGTRANSLGKSSLEKRWFRNFKQTTPPV